MGIMGTGPEPSHMPHKWAASGHGRRALVRSFVTADTLLEAPTVRSAVLAPTLQ